MRKLPRLLMVPALLAALLVAATALALEGWHATPADAVEAARTSGKPILVVTCWKDGICRSCDTWRARVPKNAAVAKQLERFERVYWLYDGLGGEVITWTKEHGGQSDDPAAQAFLLNDDGTFSERADDNTCYTPKRFGVWLEKFADRHEKRYPRTLLPFVRVDVAQAGDAWRCAALDEARTAGRRVLLYVGRKDREGDDAAARSEAEAARRFERGTLRSKEAAKAAEGWTLLRIDTSRAPDRGLARSFGAPKAPALLLVVPGEDEPQVLPDGITGPALAERLSKAAETGR